MDACNLLSEETLDLCSSFEHDLESDTSFEASPLSFHCNKNNTNNEDNIYNSPESFYSRNKFSQESEINCSVSNSAGNPFSPNNCSDIESKFNTPENRSFSMVKMFDSLCLDDGQFTLKAKVKEFKTILSEANDAYINLLISQFLLDSYKSIKLHISPELADKVDEAFTVSIVDKLSGLKSKKGERYNLLGVEKCETLVTTEGMLSSTEKVLLSKRTVAVLKSKVQQLSSQQKTLRGAFGAHCQEVIQPATIMCEERERLADLHICVRKQLEQACQLLFSTNQLMEQLAHTLQSSEQALVAATYISVRDKAKYLRSTARVLRLKIEEGLYEDKDQTMALNAVGCELKTSVDASTAELMSLQTTLSEYEKKEETSRQYKELVADYAKTKRQLYHNYQTLNVLNDPDISFS